MKIRFFYNDGSVYEKELINSNDKTAIECGVLRALYSIALNTPDNFKDHFCLGYELYNEKGELIDRQIYKKVERRKS